jgi:toxin FitB
MSYLLDTVVLSEMRKSKPSPKVLAWLKRQKFDDLFISVVSVGEIERGIVMAQKTNPVFSDELTLWLQQLLTLHADRVLPITSNIARIWGKLSAQLGHEGADILIAATAINHKLTVVTRNVKHFEPAIVHIVNPFV